MSNWYYVDATGQQVGPISADELRAAFQRGAAVPATLAWRDGLASWQPIADLAAELGIGVVISPAASQGLPPRITPAPGTQSTEANPYRAPDSESGEGFFQGTDVVYAGFWRRWAALFLDQLIIGIP